MKNVPLYEKVQVKPYGVIPWTSTTFAVVCMEQLRKGVRDEDAMLITESEDRERVAQRLNEKWEQARQSVLAERGVLQLDEPSLRKLIRIREGGREAVASDLTVALVYKLMEMLPKGMQEGLDASLEAAVFEDVAIVRTLIDTAYQQGLKAGVMKPV